MGVGLYLRGVVKNVGPADKRSTATRLPALVASIREAIQDDLLRSFVQTFPGEDRIEVLLHPAAENVEFALEPDGEIICSAKTSTCGPGYHAFLVELLEEAGEHAGISWSIESSNESAETDYWITRSFSDLQHEMAAWLHANSEWIIREASEYSNLMINMPTGFPMLANELECYVVTPLGPRTREWIEMTAASIEAAARSGPNFFPWWNAGLDANFWRGFGLVLAWGNLRWTAPRDEQERATLELALESFNHARRSGARGLPEDEIHEIQELLRTNASSLAVSPDSYPTRIGYRRRHMRRPLTGQWSTVVPGYYDNDEENDGDTIVYWYGDRTVRGSSFTIQAKGGRTVPANEMVAEIKPTRQQIAELIDERTSDPPGWATIERAAENGDEYWLLRGRTGAPNELCLTTICYTNDADRDWAIRTWRSARRTPNEDQAP